MRDIWKETDEPKNKNGIVLKKKVPGVCGQALNSVARNCETDHEKAVFDIIQIVHKL